ncbi:hypothetical protein CNF00450 [Cryptococcus deneoformans JEC21]|uniref:ELMO domain-containing protein n=1 Tax=Cryptococcus deneoformans (strain JEC21 / ATCC MYA-565) TaxID=214684 RepID=A0A0S2M5H4_CRYD1|nr:hypothetical protein CNF00450 [Cryptococcus neoformans var. neoformans JEC21]ALO68970.1 hypothetical protein CNF00450 [Cryptococcus neoformans var. neoformans JEC21]
MDQSGVEPFTSKQAIPTNVVTFKGRRIPARIDPEARITYIVEVMAASFATEEHHITLCLRDEEDNLVTQNNLPSKVYNHDTLKLCASPTTEALIVVASLKSTRRRSLAESTPDTPPAEDVLPLKLALFNFQKFVSEEEFTAEFLLKGGMRTLVKILESENGLTGNTLAYALQGIRGVLEYESAWADLTDTFITRILLLLIYATQPNVLRPATAIIRKLVISRLSSSHHDNPPELLISASTKAPGLKPGLGPGPRHDVIGGKNRAKRKSRELTPAEKDQHHHYKGHSLYGFDKLYILIKQLNIVSSGEDEGSVANAEYLFKILVKRLEGTGDLELVAQSLGLINACLRSGNQEGSRQYNELVWILEKLGICRYVSRLIPTSTNNIISPHILDFQSRLCVILQHKRLRSVRPGQYKEHEKMLKDIWEAGKLGELAKKIGGEAGDGGWEAMSGGQLGMSTGAGLGAEPGTGMGKFGLGLGEIDRGVKGWWMIGLGEEDQDGVLGEGAMFRDVGELGLECLHWFATHEERFNNLVMEQQAKPAERRCPIGKASAECVKLLCEHYKISQAGTGHHAPTSFQLFLLNFPNLHHLVLKFFLRMWQESNSCTPDFYRLTHLIRSHLTLTLSPTTTSLIATTANTTRSSSSQTTSIDELLPELSKNWFHLEQDFLTTAYRTIRDRQMDFLEKEGGMMRRNAVRSLKKKLGKEVWDVVCEQRVGCMLQGGWFNAARLLVPGMVVMAKANPSKPLRFLRLSEDRKTIAWDDFEQRSGSPSFESLTHRIKISSISSVKQETSTPVNSRSPNLISKLSFSLISSLPTATGVTLEKSLLDLDAIHAAQLAEWSDGIKVLKDGGMTSQDSANYIQILTELALNIRLLDITGDGVEIPENVDIGPAPRSVDFVFAK